MSSKAEDISVLIDGCLSNDRKSQRMLYEKYFNKMVYTCMRYTKSRDEAMDVAQEGFIKIFSSMERFDRTGSFEGWMKRIMVNYAVDCYRKRQKENYISTDSDYILDQEENIFDIDGQDQDVFANIDPKMVMQEIQNLSPAYQMVFNLFVIEGFSHKQIAEALKINEGTSKSNLAKARANLQQALSKYIVKH